jgi:hypothetical protein
MRDLDGRYERYEGLHVLRLAGDDYTMGYQHGALLRDAVRRGPVPYFERYVERMIGAGIGPAAGRGAAALLGHTVGRRIAARFPDRVRRALDGLADGAGLSRGALQRAVTMPETYLWVLYQMLRVRGLPLAPRHGVPLMGCTSAAAWGEATRDGRLLHGRNFDYQGVGAWDTEQAVVFHRPDGCQPYVSVSAAGILLGGVTAMNASGLTLVVHQHMASDAFRLGGLPIGVAGDEVMRHARTLDDARRLLDDHRPSGCWTYVVTSGHERDALCYEVTPHGRAWTRASGDTFAYSNLFLDATLAATERHLYPAHWRNNAHRWRRTGGLLAERRGAIDADAIAGILGDRGSGPCQFEDAISMIMTVASVVFRPEDGVFWVGTGRAPTSTRPYVAFDLGREAPRPDLAPLRGGVPADEALAAALDAYRAAHEAYFDRGDVPVARARLARARELRPSEPLFAYVAGLMALLDEDAAGAERALDEALALGHFEAERVAAFHLWRGRARDLQGRRAGALEDYHAATAGDLTVAAAARRGLSRPWRARRFGVELTFAEVPMP